MIASLALVALLAQTEGAPVRVEPNALQYMQSCTPGPSYGIQFSAANRAKVLTVPGTSAPVFLPFGTQWKVSCNNAGAVLACLHQTQTTTVSLGIGSDGGDGAGWISHDAATTQAGPGRCIALTGEIGTDFVKVSQAAFSCSVAAGSRTPTTRCGRCTIASNGFSIGAPCSVNADCGASGTCSTRSALGAYLSFVPVSASSVCWINRCDQ
jgi:hypothetical protein